MSVRQVAARAHARSLSIVVWVAVALACLIPSVVVAQGAPKVQWFDNSIQFVRQCVSSPDGKTLAVVEHNKDADVVELRDASTGQVQHSFKTELIR